MSKQESRDPIPSLTLTLIISQTLEKSLILWNNNIAEQYRVTRMLGYRISKDTSKFKIVNVSMTTIISYPKNIPVLSWELGIVNTHIYLVHTLWNNQLPRTGMTSANIFENGAKRKVLSIFHT